MLNSNFTHFYKYILKTKIIVSAILVIILSLKSYYSLAQNRYFDSTQVFNWNDKNVTIKDLPKNKLYVIQYSQTLDKKILDSVELLRRNNYINFCLIFDKHSNSINLKEFEKQLPLYFLKRTKKEKNNYDQFILTNNKYEIVGSANSFVALIKYLEEYYMINDGINIEPK
jgi:hypothetical protein